MDEFKRQIALLSEGCLKAESLEEYFTELATTLFNRVKIVSPHGEYLIRDFEWYYYNPAINHLDTYFHRHPRQGLVGCWYFHRYGKDPHAFLRNRRNGVDITFGNTPKEIYGGMLIRSIASVEEHHPISGINKVVRELIRSLLPDQLHNLATASTVDVFNVDALLHLQYFLPNIMRSIQSTPRIGLPEPL